MPGAVPISVEPGKVEEKKKKKETSLEALGRRELRAKREKRM